MSSNILNSILDEWSWGRSDISGFPIDFMNDLNKDEINIVDELETYSVSIESVTRKYMTKTTTSKTTEVLFNKIVQVI